MEALVYTFLLIGTLIVIFFAVFFGVILVLIPKKHSEPVSKLTDSFNAIFLKMVEVVMLAAPFFVFALLAGVMAKIAGDNPVGVVEVFKGLGVYSVVVLEPLKLIFVINLI